MAAGPFAPDPGRNRSACPAIVASPVPRLPCSWLAAVPPRWHPSPQASCPVTDRRAEIRAGFQALRLGQPECARRAARVRQLAEGSFDSLNPFSFKGQKAAGLGLDLRFADGRQPRRGIDRNTGLICEWVSYPADFSSVTFRLAPRRASRTASPITPKTSSSRSKRRKKPTAGRALLQERRSRPRRPANQVTFTFDSKGNRELPQIVGQLKCSRSTTGKARTRTVSRATSPRRRWSRRSAPGPIASRMCEPGRSITYERVKD